MAAGCLVFLVYLLYSYHNLPQEGGEGGGQVVKHEEEEEDSGVPVLPAKQVSSVLCNNLHLGKYLFHLLSVLSNLHTIKLM